MGTGIPKILRELKKNGSPKPEFDMDEVRTYLDTIIYIIDGLMLNFIGIVYGRVRKYAR